MKFNTIKAIKCEFELKLRFIENENRIFSKGKNANIGKISFFLLTRQLFFLFAFSSLKTIFKCL